MSNLLDTRNDVEFDEEERGFSHEFAKEVAARAPFEYLGHDETIEHMLTKNPGRKDEIMKFLVDPSTCVDEHKILAQMKPDSIDGAAAKGKLVRMIMPEETFKLYTDTRFMQPWSAAMKRRGDICTKTNKHWYQPGSSPEDISASVCKANRDCERRKNVMKGTDFVKYDLHNSKSTRLSFEISIGLACIDKDKRKIVRRAVRSEINMTIKAKLKEKKNDAPKPRDPKLKKVKSGHMVCSGAADTTGLNSYTNGLISYITLRKLGYSHEAAFEMLLPKYGDDGCEEYADKWKETAEKLGFRVKVDPRKSTR